jgi:hypothetical protein
MEEKLLRSRCDIWMLDRYLYQIPWYCYIAFPELFGLMELLWGIKCLGNWGQMRGGEYVPE